MFVSAGYRDGQMYGSSAVFKVCSSCRAGPADLIHPDVQRMAAKRMTLSGLSNRKVNTWMMMMIMVVMKGQVPQR